MLPKAHPIEKTHVELRRCKARVEEFIARFPEYALNEADEYQKLCDSIQTALDAVPIEHRSPTAR
jgi:hypothetical protein